MNVLIHLGNYVAAHRLGNVFAPCGFQIGWNPDTVLAPAVAFVRGFRRFDQLSEGYHQGPPDLAVECVDPSERPNHLEIKIAEWRAVGCPMLIVVNPRKRCATVYRSPDQITHLSEADEIDGGEIVDGWKLPVREIFEW